MSHLYITIIFLFTLFNSYSIIHSNLWSNDNSSIFSISLIFFSFPSPTTSSLTIICELGNDSPQTSHSNSSRLLFFLQWNTYIISLFLHQYGTILENRIFANYKTQQNFPKLIIYAIIPYNTRRSILVMTAGWPVAKKDENSIAKFSKFLNVPAVQL